jgi:hypothetical protein
VVVIAPPYVAQPTMAIGALTMLTFTNLAVGTNYQLQFLDDGGWSNVGGAFPATSVTLTQFVGGAAGLTAYQLATCPLPSQAYATAVVSNGFVVHAKVTAGGAGYPTAPVVSIVGGGGSNATATATVSGGAVTAVTITDAGIGYTNTPSIVMGPPGAAPVNLAPTLEPVVELNLGSLAPYDDYQLEFEAVLGGGWTSLGDPLTPTSPTASQYVAVAGNSGFFRLQHLP